MSTRVRALTQAFDAGERRRLAALYGVVAALHVLGFGLLFAFAGRYPAFVGLGVVAYTFGLRHAFDADHISAIDNTTRKLLQQGRKPMGVGFFFSLGHSTVVFAIAILLALAVRTIVGSVVDEGGRLHSIGGLIGTTVSAAFLLAIGAVNLLVLLDVARAYRRMRTGRQDRESLGTDLVAGGVFSRVFSGLFRLVSSSWHMYPIGVLFGLGFDTATEVALLGVSAGAAAKGVSFLTVISLPLLFTAGMSLMDTTDGAFMAKAYAWAFSNPIRKVFYNLTVTSLSVFVALFVGAVEAAQLLSGLANLTGGVWAAIAGLDFETVGGVIVAAFVLTWAAALAYYRLGRVEQRWTARAELDGVDGTQ